MVCQFSGLGRPGLLYVRLDVGLAPTGRRGDNNLRVVSCREVQHSQELRQHVNVHIQSFSKPLHDWIVRNNSRRCGTLGGWKWGGIERERECGRLRHSEQLVADASATSRRRLCLGTRRSLKLQAKMIDLIILLVDLRAKLLKLGIPRLLDSS